jgi:hypothetical protein
MKLDKRKIYILLGAAIVVGATTFIIVRRKKNNKKIDLINKILDGKAEDPSQDVNAISGYWTANYWKSLSPNTKLVNDPAIFAYVKKIAQQIYDGVSPSLSNPITDNPSQITAAFNTVNSQLGISVLSDAFQQIYNKDLLSWLTDRMDTTEQKMALEKIKSRANALPSKLAGE